MKYVLQILIKTLRFFIVNIISDSSNAGYAPADAGETEGLSTR